MSSWFDSHCHLHLCEEQEEVTKVMAHARAAGVGNLLAVGIDVESSRPHAAPPQAITDKIKKRTG